MGDNLRIPLTGQDRYDTLYSEMKKTCEAVTEYGKKKKI